MSPRTTPLLWRRRRTGTKAGTGSVEQVVMVMARTSSGTGAGLVFDHGGGGEVVAVEQLVLVTDGVAAPMPPRRLGIGGGPVCAGGERPGLDVAPVDRQRGAGRLVALGDAGFDDGVED